MTALILELKQGESMILNGALIRFKTRTRLELNTQARFLFGKQIMRPEDATTPAAKIYYALQEAYIGEEAARHAALVRARALIAAQPASPGLCQLLEVIGEAAGFEALKLARQMIRDEAAGVS